jgi:hypothetical protein
MSDSETIYSESEISEDSDSEGSLVDFVAESDEEPEACLACHAEICVSNIINRKRRRMPAVHDESSDEEDEGEESEDSDYVPSESESDDGECSECSDSSSGDDNSE